MTLAVVLVVAYILGSIPTSYIVVFRLSGRDIRTMGTGNPGTMNVLDTLGWKAAGLVATGDICKGAAAVALAYLAGLGDEQAILAALAAVIGHDWSVFLRFDGGNGTAAAIGGMLALLPFETLVAATISVGVGVLLGSRRLGGLVGIALVPMFAYALDAPQTRLYGVLLLMAFTVLKIVRDEGFSPARPGR